jgi:hypothetical protein
MSPFTNNLWKLLKKIPCFQQAAAGPGSLMSLTRFHARVCRPLRGLAGHHGGAVDYPKEYSSIRNTNCICPSEAQ